MEKERIKYESPWTSQRQVVVETFMEALSLAIVTGKENLEPLKEVNDIQDSQWEGPSASKGNFNYTWD